MTEKEDFEPKIIGFLCNWCAYAGADLAGVSRIQYPPNIRIVRVMCSGRIDPVFILEAFKNGADGVLVAGCHLPSDCHYVNGNCKTLNRITLVKKILQEFGRARTFAIGMDFGERRRQICNNSTRHD